MPVGLSLSTTVPSEFYCPITGELMAQPSTAADGKTYEEAAIIAWIREARGKPTSPWTRQPLQHTTVIPNLNLRALMDQHPIASQQLLPLRQSSFSADAKADSALTQCWSLLSGKPERYVPAAVLVSLTAYGGSCIGQGLGYVAGVGLERAFPKSAFVAVCRQVAPAAFTAWFGAASALLTGAQLVQDVLWTERAIEMMACPLAGALLTSAGAALDVGYAYGIRCLAQPEACGTLVAQGAQPGLWLGLITTAVLITRRLNYGRVLMQMMEG